MAPLTNRSITAHVMAGIPAVNRSIYRQVRFLVGDPVAFAQIGDERVLILRDIEMDRARDGAAGGFFHRSRSHLDLGHDRADFWL